MQENKSDCFFSEHCVYITLVTTFSLTFVKLSLVGLVVYTIIRQCYDTVGWVLRPENRPPK